MIAAEQTRMHVEASQAAEVVRAQLRTNRDTVLELGAALRAMAPRAIVTCARGSSDHAATFAKYLIETKLGILTSSAAPSVSSVYAATPNLSGALFLAISQSGASPDLLAAVASAKSAGANVLALVNNETSPLAEIAHRVLGLRAGIESSVAATKSYIATLAALIHLIATWSDDRDLQNELERSPEKLDEAWRLDWQAALPILKSARSVYVIGRGLGLGIAQEAALKFKETCGLHAEAFSAAEVRHGPMTIVTAGFPVLLFVQNDDTRASVEELAAEFVRRRAHVFIAGASCNGAIELPTIHAHPIIEPMLIIQTFYRMVNELALQRGRDPDRPPFLSKVTETV